MGRLGKNEHMTAAQCTAHLRSVADALYVIGGKWKLRIIIALRDGKKRFGELQKRVEGISAKVLSSELKELELNGFVVRNVFAETPVIIEYELTDYAGTLTGVLNELGSWGAMHKERIRKSMKKKSVA